MKAIVHQWSSALICLLWLVLMTACRSTTVNLPVFSRTTSQPQGVDSLIVARSDSIIKFLFVDYPSKQKAERLLQSALNGLTRADSLYKKFNELQTDTLQTSSDMVIDSSATSLKNSLELLKQIRNELQLAEENLLQATRLNPFSLISKEALAQTYILKANVESSDLHFEKAVGVLEDIITTERGEHLIFSKLAECYYNLKNWQKALDNYIEAEKVLLACNFTVDSVLVELPPNDSLKNEIHADYLYSQAICLARMYKAPEALMVLKKAKEKTSSASKRQKVERYEDWLTWDNGNIRASEEKNSILELVQKKKYEEAVARFEQLKKQLSDPRAIDEIDWRIAGIEFTFLNRKQQACDRLLRVVQKYPAAPKNPDDQADYEMYVNDCGIMHYHLGIEFIQASDYKQAQKYLDQGAKLNWDGNYKCLLELANLNKHDPNFILNIIERVLQEPLKLSDEERLTALEMKLSALRKMGPAYISEASRIYQEIRELQKKR